MIIICNKLGSHIAYTTSTKLKIFLFQEGRNAKISKVRFSFLADNNILWFNISMDYITIIEILQCLYQTANELFFISKRLTNLLLAED